MAPRGWRRGAPMQVGHKVLATTCLLCVLAANGEGRQLQTGSETTEEEVEAPPEGMLLKEVLPNGSIPIKIVPDWELFLGFEDRTKVIRGKLTLSIIYYPEALRFVSDPQKIVSVDNFGDGDRYLQGTVNLVDPTTGREAIATSNIYVGDFSQSQSMFDHSCYPFDDKKVKFEISIQKPGDYVFSLDMLCPLPRVSETVVDKRGVKRIIKCSDSPHGSYVGFDWGSFICEPIEDRNMVCYIIGTRHWESVFKGHIWPSFTFSAMGFLSFALSVKMAMPRVATTMLALVSLTSLRNSVMNILPASGNTSWLEEYYLISMTFMLLNLCGHAFSFYLDGKAKSAAQKMVNKINFFGMIAIYFLVTVWRLHVRECPLVDHSLSTALVVLGALWVIVSFAIIVYMYGDARHEVVDLAREIMGRQKKDPDFVE